MGYTIPLWCEPYMSDLEKTAYLSIMGRADLSYRRGDYVQSDRHHRWAITFCEQIYKEAKEREERIKLKTSIRNEIIARVNDGEWIADVLETTLDKL